MCEAACSRAAKLGGDTMVPFRRGLGWLLCKCLITKRGLHAQNCRRLLYVRPWPRQKQARENSSGVKALAGFVNKSVPNRGNRPPATGIVANGDKLVPGAILQVKASSQSASMPECLGPLGSESQGRMKAEKAICVTDGGRSRLLLSWQIFLLSVSV